MLAVTGGKGGAGKTTTALGLATVLAHRRRDPVVLDADVDMPNLHIRAGGPDTGLAKLAAGASIDEAAEEAARYPGIDVIGASPGTPLDRALRAIATDRPVILDGAAGASERAVTPLRHADRAVVVTRDTPAAVTDTVKSIRMARNVGTPVVAVAVSRTSDVSDDLVGAIPAEPIIPIPDEKEPVTHTSVREAYSRIIDTWINA